MIKTTNDDRREIVVFMFSSWCYGFLQHQTQQIASHLLTNHGAVSLFS